MTRPARRWRSGRAIRPDPLRPEPDAWERGLLAQARAMCDAIRAEEDQR